MNPSYFISFIVVLFSTISIQSQNLFIPEDSSSGLVSFSFSANGSFQNFGCLGQDPTYWLNDANDTVVINFTSPQLNPSFRVWGMNDDDSAMVLVNKSP